MTPDKRVENFEKYLEDVCFEANPSVLDDDMPDFFDNWLSQQEGEDYTRHANNYHQDLKEIIQIIKDSGIDADQAVNDHTSHYIADDAFNSKVDAFYYGYNQAIVDILKKIAP